MEKDFSIRLKELIKDTGYNQVEITRKIGLSKNAISNYVNGQIPNAKILLKLSQFLGTSMEYLLTGKEPEIKPVFTLSETEKEMLALFKQLAKKEQYKLIGRIEAILEMQKQVEKSKSEQSYTYQNIEKNKEIG